MPEDPRLRTFPDEFVPNMQGSVYYPKWVKSSPADAARWAAFRDALLAGQTPSVPTMSTKFGKALVAAGEEHMSISQLVGQVTNPYPPPPPPPVLTSFAKYASPSGSDSNSGTFESPYLTFRKLANSLPAGQSGALRAGTYGDADTYQLINAGGSSGQPITVTNYPGESVTVKGYLDITASHVTVKNLHIDGSNPVLVSPSKCGTQALGITAKGTGIIFEYCEIYHSGMKGSGFVSNGPGLIIRYCTIHDIGYCYAYDHGLYRGGGDGGEFYGNWIWNNPHGWGFQVYPAPSNGRFYANVVDACGAGFVFGDEGAPTCTGNEAYNNVIINSVGMWTQGGAFITGAGITGAAPQPGTGNVFRDNCCYNNPGGVGSQTNVTIAGNITSDPLFVDASNHDYRLLPGSPCAGYGLPTFIPGPTV